MFHQINSRILLLCLLIFGSLSVVPAQTTDDSLLSIDRIFNSSDFDPQGVGGFRWLKSGNAYTKIEPSVAVKGGTDLVSYEIETNKRTVLLSAEKLIGKGFLLTYPLSRT